MTVPARTPASCARALRGTRRKAAASAVTPARVSIERQLARGLERMGPTVDMAGCLCMSGVYWLGRRAWRRDALPVGGRDFRCIRNGKTVAEPPAPQDGRILRIRHTHR